MPAPHRDRVHRRFIYASINWGVAGSGGKRQASFAMKTSLVVALTVAFVLAGGSALAVMNKACKSGHHPWCAPARTHVKVGRRDAHRGRSVSLAIGADDLDARGRSPMCRQRTRPIVRRRSRGSLPGFS